MDKLKALAEYKHQILLIVTVISFVFSFVFCTYMFIVAESTMSGEDVETVLATKFPIVKYFK